MRSRRFRARPTACSTCGARSAS
ncbi:hypothetical protein LGM41_31195 [Burkholderia seminalis]|nr:hypothetical protein [Burkholderia seminalis]MCA8427732.1 hypothetical protein [Burkholderia seminalis]